MQKKLFGRHVPKGPALITSFRDINDKGLNTTTKPAFSALVTQTERICFYSLCSGDLGTAKITERRFKDRRTQAQP
ncbi:MAG: hypothetical protein JSV66_15685, partial [Trueperaceae bacterium]